MSENPLHDASWSQVIPEREDVVETWSRRVVLSSVVLFAVGWFFFWVLPRHEALLNSM